MIRCYTGTPGAGKSLHSIRKILDFLEDGKNVIANFPIKLDKIPYKKLKGRFFYVPNEKITVDFLYQFHVMFHADDIENQTLLMIDEASVKFNCRNYSEKDRMSFCTFFAQHRKFCYSIILVCQNLRQIDRQIRDLIELEVIHRKLNHYSFYRILPFSLFVAVERNIVIKDKNEHEFFLYSKRLGNLYDTFYDFTRTDKFKGNHHLESDVLKSEIKKAQKIKPKNKIAVLFDEDEEEEEFLNTDFKFKSKFLQFLNVKKDFFDDTPVRQGEGVPLAGAHPLPDSDNNKSLLDISNT